VTSRFFVVKIGLNWNYLDIGAVKRLLPHFVDRVGCGVIVGDLNEQVGDAVFVKVGDCVVMPPVSAVRSRSFAGESVG
jgi:hypothetical protein